MKVHNGLQLIPATMPDGEMEGRCLTGSKRLVIVWVTAACMHNQSDKRGLAWT